jgi:hypothetical protein
MNAVPTADHPNMAGGYSYRVFSDGRIQIIAGPAGVGAVLQPGSQAHAAVVAEIQANPHTARSPGSAPTAVGSGVVPPAPSGVVQAAQAGQAAAQQDRQTGQFWQSLVGQLPDLAAPLTQIVGTAASAVSQGRSNDLARLQAQRAQKVRALDNTNPRNTVRVARLQGQIMQIDQQIQAYQTALASGIPAQLSPAPQPTVPVWAIAGAGIVVTGIALALLFSNPAPTRRRRAGPVRAR